MSAPAVFAEKRSELEERIRSLENEKAELITEVTGLKENLETLKLQRKAKSLESEVSGLRAEKSAFEEEFGRLLREEQQSITTSSNTPDAPQITVQSN